MAAGLHPEAVESPEALHGVVESIDVGGHGDVGLCELGHQHGRALEQQRRRELPGGQVLPGQVLHQLPGPAFALAERPRAHHRRDGLEVGVLGVVGHPPQHGPHPPLPRHQATPPLGQVLDEHRLEHADAGDRGDQLDEVRRRRRLARGTPLHLAEDGARAHRREQLEAPVSQSLGAVQPAGQRRRAGGGGGRGGAHRSRSGTAPGNTLSATPSIGPSEAPSRHLGRGFPDPTGAYADHVYYV